MIKKSFIFTLFASSIAFGATYIVKEGETLSDILYQNYEGLIYGRHGNLAKLIQANSQIKDPNQISQNQVITIPDDFRPILKSQKEKSSQTKAISNTNSYLTLGARSNFESLAATEKLSNEKEISSSELGYGVYLRWTHFWSDRFRFFLDSSMSKVRFKVSENKTLARDEFIKSYVGVGLSYIIGKGNLVEFGTGLGESFVLNSKTSTELKIDKIVIPSLSFSGVHEIAAFNSGYSFKGLWRAGALLPTTQSDFSTELGNYWSLGAGSFFERNEKSFNIIVTYGQRAVETNDIKQTNKDIGISTGVGFKF